MFGGAAMALAYDSRRATRDVDALFEPHGIVHEEALAVATELGLPRWWLNEQASFPCTGWPRPSPRGKFTTQKWERRFPVLAEISRITATA